MKIIKHRWAVPVEVLLYPTLQMTPQQEKTSVKHFRQFQKLMKEQQVLIRHETREGAVAKAEQMRTKKIAALRKQIERLEKMRFDK
jgi:predicted Rossmann fold nucleotide-binding protein DprA/Smf involved in DNA uptake